MRKPFNDIMELYQSGFTIGGLDTGATKFIFQVRELCRLLRPTDPVFAEWW